jgi:hypothetical protein
MRMHKISTQTQGLTDGCRIGHGPFASPFPRMHGVIAVLYDKPSVSQDPLIAYRGSELAIIYENTDQNSVSMKASVFPKVVTRIYVDCIYRRPSPGRVQRQ